MAKHMQVARWVMTLATIFILLLLAWQCIDIYLEGNSPSNLADNGVHLSPVFSAEIVGARLRPILPLLAVYVLLVLGALIVQSVAGADRGWVSVSPENRLRLVKARMDVLPGEAETLERQRRSIRLTAAAAVLVCAVPCLVYLLNGANFTSWELESVMGRMLLHVAPWVAAAFAVAVAASFACGRSAERELAALKGHVGQAKPEKPASRRRPLGALRACLYTVAVVFIVLGVMNGGLHDVLVKAINICTECIGLG